MHLIRPLSNLKTKKLLVFGIFILGCTINVQATTCAPLANNRSFADILEGKLDAVVNISATHSSIGGDEINSLPEDVFDVPFGEAFRGLFSMPPRPASQKITSLGSGFIISESGLIVTNYHVIRNVAQEKGEIRVIFNSGEELLATVVGSDFRSDLALLKIKTDKPLTALKWANSQKARVGDYVLAVGHPFGLGCTVTSGIVSHTNRNLPGKLGQATHVDQWIQTDAPINQGSSGGPLLNMDGEVIGVNTAIFTPTGGNIGIALVIPSKVAMTVISELERNGCIKRGYMGIQIGLAVTKDVATNLGMKQTQGVMVDDVKSKSPADRANIKSGDVIVKVGDTVITTAYQLRSLISATKPGDQVKITLWKSRAEKGNNETVINIAVEELPSEFCNVSSEKEFNRQAGRSILGMSIKNINNIPAGRYDLEDSIQSGVVITRIQSNSAASEKLRVGDLILSMGTMPVENSDQCNQLIQEAVQQKRKTILFLIARPGNGKCHILVKIDGQASDI